MGKYTEGVCERNGGRTDILLRGNKSRRLPDASNKFLNLFK